MFYIFSVCVELPRDHQRQKEIAFVNDIHTDVFNAWPK